MARLTNLVLRCPFTLLMLAVLIAAGISGQSHIGSLNVDIHRQLGHSPRLMFEGHLHRPVTSLYFTAGGWSFYRSLLMFAASVGWAEHDHGTRRAALAFFGIHLATLLIMAIAIALSLSMLATLRGELLFNVRDVEPSGGNYGCLGVMIAGLCCWKRNAAASIITLVLLVRLTSSTMHLPEAGRMMSADLAHLIAFPLGLLCHRISQEESAS